MFDLFHVDRALRSFNKSSMDAGMSTQKYDLLFSSMILGYAGNFFRMPVLESLNGVFGI